MNTSSDVNLTIGQTIYICVTIIVTFLAILLSLYFKKYLENKNKIEEIIEEGRIPLSRARDESQNSIMHQIALPRAKEKTRGVILNYIQKNLEIQLRKQNHADAIYINNDDPESNQHLIVNTTRAISCDSNVKSLLMATNNRGETPLHLASKYQTKRCLQFSH